MRRAHQARFHSDWMPFTSRAGLGLAQALSTVSSLRSTASRGTAAFTLKTAPHLSG